MPDRPLNLADGVAIANALALVLQAALKSTNKEADIARAVADLITGDVESARASILKYAETPVDDDREAYLTAFAAIKQLAERLGTEI